MQLAIDQRLGDDRIRSITKISANRWNHQVVIRSLQDARSAWLGKLIERAYAYGLK